MQARPVDVPGAERQAPAPEAAWHALSAEEVLRAEEADPRHGLSSAEAASRAGRFGPNTLAAGRAEPRWRAFIRQYSDPMQIVLLVAGLLSLFPLRQPGTGLLLILLTLANAVLGLQQEGGAESAVAALQRRLIVTARVRRDGQEAEIPAAQLVPGDVVSIEAGDVVPADGVHEYLCHPRDGRVRGHRDRDGDRSRPHLGNAPGAAGGKGYPAHGRINRVAGQAEIPLDQFLMPMVLASDAVLSDGELIGDPTEGALVALAAKGGIDAVLTRQVHPRIAGLPFDAEYKLMATFHKMTDESGKAVIRCFVKGAPDQLLTRAATVLDPDAGPVRLDGRLRERYLAGNHRFAEEGLRVMATARRDFDPAAFDPGADLSRPVEGLMERRPRPPGQPILSGWVLAWLVSVGLVMAIGTLSVPSARSPTGRAS